MIEPVSVPWDEKFERILRANLRALASNVPLLPDDSLYGLGLDSVSTLEIVVALEDTYDVVIDDDGSNPDDVFATPAGLWSALVVPNPHIVGAHGAGRTDDT